MSYLYRLVGDLVNFSIRQVAAGGKAPGTIDQHPHTHALCFRRKQLLDDTVLYRQVLLAMIYNPGIRVLGPAQLGQIQGSHE